MRAKRGNPKIISLFLIFSLCLFNAFSQQALQSHPSFEPLFKAEDVLANPNSTSLSADELFKLSLLFSECPLDSASGLYCLEQFEKIKKKVSARAFIQQEPMERGRAILKLLFQDYLKTYNIDQTKINLALETGVYNCVSSALLYMAAAKAAGLEVRGQKTTEHAFCTLYVEGSKTGTFTKIDVETTNPYGFNPGSREEIENEDKIKG